jgi:hypothetical protein
VFGISKAAAKHQRSFSRYVDEDFAHFREIIPSQHLSRKRMELRYNVKLRLQTNWSAIKFLYDWQHRAANFLLM